MSIKPKDPLTVPRNGVLHDVMSLNMWANKIHAWARSKGWWDRDQDTPVSKLLLIHSEVSEAAEDLRGDLDLNKIYYQDSNDPEKIMSNDKCGKCKPVGFASEIADTVIRILDLCAALGIDIEEAVRVKMKYNETRANRHGGKAI
jgi:NTP pyrophosphatase (non-canonical NTP hydrolase)